jgi:hypothetical protein
MQKKDLYSQSHLIVSAVRVLSHTRVEAPSVEDVCGLLTFSLEQGHLLCKKLHDMNIIEMVEGPFGLRIFVRDHLKIEELPRDETTASLQAEVEKFQSSRKDFKDQIEKFQSRKEQEKKELFAKIEEKLKKKQTK